MAAIAAARTTGSRATELLLAAGPKTSPMGNRPRGRSSWRLLSMTVCARRKHRQNIFNPNYNYAGAAFGRHARFGTMCSMDFAGGYAERGQAPTDTLVARSDAELLIRGRSGLLNRGLAALGAQLVQDRLDRRIRFQHGAAASIRGTRAGLGAVCLAPLAPRDRPSPFSMGGPQLGALFLAQRFAHRARRSFWNGRSWVDPAACAKAGRELQDAREHR